MSDIIDINVNKIVEEVTINVVDNVIQVNINNVSGGSGGSQTLAQTLDLGNTTGGENINISNGDAIVLDNGSMLKKGTIDAGNGGSKGISQICGVGFEHKWEAGRLYIMNDGGTIIREVSHNLTYTPTVTDDVTKGFVQNTRWILDNGDIYICTDPTEGAAVWELVTGVVPNLQQVTDALLNDGIAETTNGIKAGSCAMTVDGFYEGNADGGRYFQIQNSEPSFVQIDEFDNLHYLTLRAPNQLTTSPIVTFQEETGTVALLSDIPSSASFVPYTGATADVNLGEYELKSGQLTLDTTPTGTASVATTRWNDAIGSSETTLKGGNVILKNGVDLVARVVNKVTPNTTLTKANYQVVKVSGAQGQRLAVNLAQANNDNNSADTLGIVCETIATNQEGFIVTVGQLEGINTTGSLQSETWADGDVLYLSPTTAGRITNIKPTGATGHIVILGYVEYAHSVNGKIYVKIMNGWELDELHNVSISSVADKQLLSYDSASSLWKNKSVTTADIAASTNKNYVTDAQQTVIGNTSGTNTGDQDLSTLATKSMSAYSFRVNNTNATANATETTYRANGQQTYTGTITWTGTTAPSGATNHSYNWVQVGNLVTLTITLLYASAGSALNAVNMTLPTDCPNPIKPTGLSGASDILYRGSGKITTSTTATTTQSPVEALLRSNSANNGFELYLQNSASSTMRMAQITITYYTS